MNNKVVLIQVWFGKIPDYFWYHYETTKDVYGLDFILFTGLTTDRAFAI